MFQTKQLGISVYSNGDIILLIQFVGLSLFFLEICTCCNFVMPDLDQTIRGVSLVLIVDAY